MRLILDLHPDHRGFGGGTGEAEIIRASTPVASWNLPAESAELDLEAGILIVEDPDYSYPSDWSALSGDYRIKPMLVVTPTDRENEIRVEGPKVPVSLQPNAAELVKLDLDEVVREVGSGTADTGVPGVLEIMRESQLLAGHPEPVGGGGEDLHRAYVVLPIGYHDLRHDRRVWPVIYLIPGRSDARNVANTVAKLAVEPAMKGIVPQAIWVVLATGTPYGHHFFLDSSLHGPRARALVEEFIPWIDIRFRTIPKPDARLLAGEEQGGFAALHLLLEHPEVFGDAWATSPEAISLEALGTINLRDDVNAYEDADGSSNPALRTSLGSKRELIHLDVRGEVLRSRALDQPGERWSELCAAFGGGPTGNREAWWPFEPDTGRLRPIQVDKWMQNDLTRKVRMDPMLARHLNEHARIMVGDRDEYYRNLGARVLQEAVRTSLGNEGLDVEDPTWITEIDASSSIEAGMVATMMRNEEIMAILRDRGHHE
ncbi:MAG: alpha/beta hydrolase-fold protein [Planctomycetota bacterium]|nr:alpha/beta hydrolase-fold protein [Planctomycetota bacterium]